MKLKTLLKQKEQSFLPIADDKTKLLFVSPDLNTEGFYRMIAPYFELPKYGYHTRIVGLKKWDFTKTYTLDDLGITTRAIEWADYIVFKSLTQECSYFFNAIRQINPDVRLVMDIFHVLHGLPNHHPAFNKVDNDSKQNFSLNLSQMDIVTAHNKDVLSLYEYIVHKEHPHCDPHFIYIPNLVSFTGLESTYELPKQQPTSIHIGIRTDTTNYHDILQLKDVIKQLKKQYDHYITIILIGWNGRLPNGEEPLKEIVKYQKNVSFLKQYQTISKLQLDMILLPVSDHQHNCYRSNTPYLDATLLKTPVIASTHSVYGAMIKHKETGLLASSHLEWLEAIQLLIENITLRKEIATRAFNYVCEFYTFSDTRSYSISKLFYNTL